LAIGLLALACLVVLRPFLTPILWAGILAYTTWPLYFRVRAIFRGHESAAALALTLLVVIVAIVPLLWMLVLVQRELADAFSAFSSYLRQGPHQLPPVVRDLPILGPLLQEALDRYSDDPAALPREIAIILQRWSGEILALLGGVGRSVGKLLITIITLFFFYRDGPRLAEQAKRVGARCFGERLDEGFRAVGPITRAVLYGFVLTVLAQGFIAGLGYWFLGVEAPVLLGALTGIAAPVPLIGTGIIWVPIAVSLVIAGPLWKGVLLLLWGVLLVHPIDNVLRPLLISNASRLPILLIMFGVLGGLAAFGLVGVFVGPVLLGVASVLWRHWASDAAAPTETSPIEITGERSTRTRGTV
jgi:predicted PurR-regulated permease PerM